MIRIGVRVAGLSLTALFISQMAVVLIDMPYHWLSSHLEGLGLRLAMFALFLVFGFLFFLLVQKASTQTHFPPGLSSERQIELIEGGGKPVECGWLEDKFGLSWQVSPRILDDMLKKGTPAQQDAVTKVFLKMKKLEIAPIKEAFETAK